MVPSVKGCISALSQVFSLMGEDLTDIDIISRIFSNLERYCLPREIRLPECNLSLVQKSLTRLLYDPLKFSLCKHPAYKTFFLLVFPLVERVSELHSSSCGVRHSRGFRSGIYDSMLEFAVKTQNPSILNLSF